jgi:aspartyl-tRNA(Asn)/glutamyl-tRNA(Gln) amidotransferase subunit B
MLKLSHMDLEVIIGLEIHAQASSKTKMFCSCDNDSFGKEPNTNVCPVCMAFPGMLPVPNKEAVEKGIKAALSLNCEILPHSKFDRKNYFYPDLPPGFQISQYDEPVSENGYVEIETSEGVKKIGITRLHLENDAGKLTHTGQATLLDYNRAGTPLMEIVSDPDLRSAEEARAYAETVQKILRYAGSSDCDMEKGMMRFDASVSLRPHGDEKLYPRAEIKNLNSFRSLERAIEYEIKRQKRLWEEGTPQAGEVTVGWDDDRATTEVMREKESAADYRYFPEPDIPPIDVSEADLAKWLAEKPELPGLKEKRFREEYGLQEQEAVFYTEDIELANFFEEVAKATSAKSANSFVGTILIKALKDQKLSIQESPVSAEAMIELIQAVESGDISNNAAKGPVFTHMMTSDRSVAQIIEDEGLAQVTDTAEIEAFCKQAIESNQKAAQDVKDGQLKAMGALVGMVMKLSKGQANPKLVNDILKKLLL